ncbi:MAG: cobalamin B12-binding domain-containing protein [Candidatus Freyarchaeota archaeon]
MSLHEEFVKTLADLDERSLQILKKMVESGEDVHSILEDIRRATDKIGKMFEEKQYFISDLIMAGEMLKGALEILKPVIGTKKVKKVGKIVIGTVEGDIHDIGKNIVTALLEASGFEVIDLGIDVPPKKFVEAINKNKPETLGLSGLLTEAIESMKKTIDAIKEAGLRDKVKVIIGGGRVDEDAKKYVGADAWTRDAATGIKLIKEFVGVK